MPKQEAWEKEKKKKKLNTGCVCVSTPGDRFPVRAHKPLTTTQESLAETFASGSAKQALWAEIFESHRHGKKKMTRRLLIARSSLLVQAPERGANATRRPSAGPKPPLTRMAGARHVAPMHTAQRGTLFVACLFVFFFLFECWMCVCVFFGVTSLRRGQPCGSQL